MPIKVPTVQTGLEQSIQKAATKAGKNLKINMGPGAKSVEGLTRPLGRLTGKADEFTKSMEAANARVLAFGASVGVIAAVSNALKQLVTTSIEVEKSLTNINSILKQSESQLDSFKNQIFDIARNTGQTFDTVAEAALELSRQGLKAEEVTKRLNDALVLSRLSGLSAAESVAGLTAAVNSFSSAGLTTSDVLNKISAAAASAAVSDRDLIEGLKRSGAVAVTAGVKFDELIGIISALQERTARGGSVIGNSLKTIFTRIQDIEKLNSLQDLGVQVTDLGGQVLSSSKIIENLAPVFAKLDQASKVNLADNLVGKFQIAPFLALLEDYNQEVSRSGQVAATSFNATNEAYKRNEVLSQTLAAAINTTTVSLKELANALGEIGATESLSKIIGVFNGIVSSITGILDGDGMGSKFAKGLIKGIGAIITGPGLALALLAIGKLLLDFAKFGTGALRTFFGLNKAAEAQRNLQGQIAASLLNDKGIRSAILSIEKQNISAAEKKILQTQFFTKALNEQLMVMQKMQGIAMTIAPGVMKGTASRRGGRAAGGFLPIGAERSDISRGVGGAPASAKPVVIPNFAFGGGKRGTMVANSSEYIVPNYANGGDAIFNQNMASSMGLPANARKVRAASGYIPNFAKTRMTPTQLKSEKRKVAGMSPSDIKSYESGVGFKAREASNTLNQKDKLVLAQKAKLDKKNLGKRSFMANKEPNKAIMLVPRRERFLMNGSDHHFMKAPYQSKAGNGLIDFFEGPSAGISKRLKKDSVEGGRLKTLLTLDGDIEKALARGINSIFTKFRKKAGPNAFKTKPGRITASNIKEQMEKGGPGALGAVKGATFEALMRAIVGGVSQNAKEGQLDVDFSKDEGNILDVIFGIQNKNFKFGDFKSSRSGGNKTKFAKQILDNVKGKVEVGRKAKTVNSKTAASGYIPNFAEGALEEAVGREKAAGLPVSQIRINQSGKLRNSQNPMGLAVTNTRDEPTGAIPAARGFIPNYSSPFPTGTPQHPASQQITQIGNAAEKSSKAIDKSTSSTQKSGGGLDKLTGKLFAFQSIMFLFQSGVGGMAEESTGATKTLIKFSQAAMQAVMALTAFQMLGGMSGLTGLAGKGAAMKTRGSRMIQAGRRLPRVTGGGIRQGMKGAGVVASGAMTAFGGALLTLVAPLAIIAAGFGAIVAINNKLTGSKEANKKALDDLTEAQKIAKNVTKKLNVGDREKFAEINETLANADVASFKGKLNQGVTGAFDGSSDDEKFATLKETIKAGYNSGMTQTDVRSILQTFANIANDPTKFDKKGEGINFRESIFGKLGRNIARTTESGKLGSSEFNSLIKMIKSNVMDRSPIQQKFEQKYRELIGQKDFDKKSAFGKEIQIQRLFDDFHREGKTGGLTMQALEASVNKIDREKDLKIAENLQKVERITLANAKSRLQTAIEVRKEHLKLLSADDKRLMKAEALGTLDDNALLALKQRIDIQKIDNDLVSKNLDFLNAQGDQMTRLKVEKGKIGKIEEEILNISAEDLKDKDKLLGIVNKIFHTNGLEKDVADSISKSLIIQLDKNEDIANASKLVLRNRQAETTELTKQKQLIKEIQAGTALTAQTELFASTNEASSERAKIEKNIKAVEARRDRIPANDREKERLTGVITSLRQKLNTVDSDQRKAAIQSDARSLFSRVPESVRTRFPEAMKAMQDPNADPLKIARSLDFSGDKNLRELQASGMPTTTTLTQKADGTFTNALPTEDIIKLKTELAKLEQKITEDQQATKDATQATKDNSIVIAESSKINKTMAQVLAPFSRSESADASRRAEAEANVAAGTDKSGGSVDLEFRRLTMGRSLRERRRENTLTDLQINDKFLNKVEETGATFRDNFAAAFAEGIKSVDDLEDALLNAANEFLKSMTTNFANKFMDQAANEMSGGEGSGGGGFFRGLARFFGFADGGKVRGGSGNRDDVPAMLMGGEFVMNKKAVQRYGSGFMEAINSGSIRGFARGGQVRDEEGMFTTPGMNGAGKIVGMRDLMSFATQSPVAMNRDTITNNGAFLDPESGRLTMFGRRNNPQFKKVQDAKRQAFDLALQEAEAHRQAKEQEVKLGDMLAAAVISSVVSFGATKLGMAAGLGEGMSGLIGSGLGNFAGTKITGAPASGGAFGAAGATGDLMDIFSGDKGGNSKSYFDVGGAGSGTGLPSAANPSSKLGFFSRIGNLFSGSGTGPPSDGPMGSMLPGHNTMPRRATGGLIPAAGGVDTVPAMLSGGEFVMNAAATKNIGAGNLQALNSGAGTGDNTDLVSKLDELIAATETSQSTGDINITINGSNEAENQTAEDATETQKQLSERIKVAVKQVIADEQRLGGQLRK